MSRRYLKLGLGGCLGEAHFDSGEFYSTYVFYELLLCIVYLIMYLID
jgi:hypothetical protein